MHILEYFSKLDLDIIDIMGTLAATSMYQLFVGIRLSLSRNFCELEMKRNHIEVTNPFSSCLVMHRIINTERLATPLNKK